MNAEIAYRVLFGGFAGGMWAAGGVYLAIAFLANSNGESAQRFIVAAAGTFLLGLVALFMVRDDAPPATSAVDAISADEAITDDEEETRPRTLRAIQIVPFAMVVALIGSSIWSGLFWIFDRTAFPLLLVEVGNDIVCTGCASAVVLLTAGAMGIPLMEIVMGVERLPELPRLQRMGLAFFFMSLGGGVGAGLYWLLAEWLGPV